MKSCCLDPSGLHKTPTSVTPSRPQTGFSHEACYAAPLKDCSSKLTREHFVSESLLHYLNRTNDLRVSGFPWLKTKEMIISPNAIASKTLCDRHNSALSKLDNIAVRLFKAFDEENVIDSNKKLLYLFSGHDLERWLLKIACGVFFSRNITTDNNVDTSIPDRWLDILFGYKEFPDEHGLYVCKDTGHLFGGQKGITLQAITSRDKFTGIGLGICGYELVLSLSGFANRHFDGRKFAYRPMEIHTRATSFEKSLLFSWSGKADLGTIHCQIRST